MPGLPAARRRLRQMEGRIMMPVPPVQAGTFFFSEANDE
jgi:hypothetical protein